MSMKEIQDNLAIVAAAQKVFEKQRGRPLDKAEEHIFFSAFILGVLYEIEDFNSKLKKT